MRFGRFLWGKHFTLKTDHKSLLQLINGETGDWSARLLHYDFTVVHKPGKSNAVADALSRLPVDCSFTDDDSYVLNALFDNLSAFTVDEVDNVSKQDQVLIKVHDFIINGWPLDEMLWMKNYYLTLQFGMNFIVGLNTV